MVYGKDFRKVHTAWTIVFIGAMLHGAAEYNPPAGYYDSADGKAGTILDSALHDIIDNHNVRSYDDFKLAARALDQDPDNTSNIILLYSGESFPANQFGSSGEVWNREHVWPQSYGVHPDFNTVGHSDMHHLFPCLASVNSVRSNRFFDWTDSNASQTHPRAGDSTYDSNSWEPRDEDKGRVARAILYMATRYAGLSDEKVESGATPPDLKISNRANSGSETMGKLTPLLEWNRLYAPDEREKKRNHGIYEGVKWGSRTYRQGNRNPFIDHPEFADGIYASSTITYGTWRLMHFSSQELDMAELSGDEADPDEDRISNLIELSANLDPNTADAASPLQVDKQADNTVTLRYHQLKQADLSGISYSIESSSNPWMEESWTTIPGSPSLTPVDQWVDEAAIGNTPSEDDTFYRLRVQRDYPLNYPGESIFDPTRHSAPAGSIFAYDSDLDANWKDSEWFGPIHTVPYPWTYHPTHHWIYIDSDSPDSIIQYDEYLGWFWTKENLYPIAYSFAKREWIVFKDANSEPNRQIMILETGAIVDEIDFNP
jgi:endonuclease I